MYQLFETKKEKKGNLLFASDDVELIAGMASCGVCIYAEKGISSYSLDTNTDLSSFRICSSVSIDKIKSINLRNILQPQEYGIWLKTNNPYRYDLFRYKTNQFIRGVLAICEHYGKHIKDYIYRYPIDRLMREYDIMNYHVKQVVIAQDAIDFDDVEIEEQDNENIIEPFARTDD
jgi:hypothetical protein